MRVLRVDVPRPAARHRQNPHHDRRAAIACIARGTGGRSAAARSAIARDVACELDDGIVQYHRMVDTATYLYCVLRSAKKPHAGRVPAGLPGGARPRLVPAGRSLWLVVSEVPLERFGAERLETALRDLDWVAQIAVAHEAVVEHFARARGTAAGHGRLRHGRSGL